MKKLMGLMLGLSLVLGTVSAFAQDTASTETTKTTKTKKHKRSKKSTAASTDTGAGAATK